MMKQIIGNTRNRGYAKPVSLGIWVFAGVAIAGFSMLLVYMDQYEKGHLSENKTINLTQLLQDKAGVRIGRSHAEADKTPVATTSQVQQNSPTVATGRQNPTSLGGGNGAANSEGKPQRASKLSSQAVSSNPPKFDFYSLLPEMEVVVPEGELQPRSKPKKIIEKKIVRTEYKNSYFIQAGAFKDLKSADRRKANLALIGIKSSIVSVSLKNRGVWHRVRVGPFADVTKMGKVRSVMKSNNISSIAVKVKS